jgi:hypothetical protein
MNMENVNGEDGKDEDEDVDVEGGVEEMASCA